MLSPRFKLLVITMHFFLLHHASIQTMDLRNSVELEEIDIEAPEKKASLLDQLKESAINYDKRQTKQLLRVVSQLESEKERNKIFIMFNNWLHDQRLTPKPFIIKSQDRHHEIMCCSLLFIFLAAGSIFIMATSPLQNIMIAGTVALVFLLGICFDNCKLLSLLEKTEEIENNNHEISATQNILFHRISHLYKVHRKPQISHAKILVKNIVKKAKNEN